jgi:large subunit ribosomal protein L23
MNTVIIKPIITEKSMNDVSGKKYTFAVARFANKTEIKRALKTAFNITVLSVATSVVKGKKKRVGMKRKEVTESVWKRATVQLKKGEKLSLFEPSEEKK